MANEQNLMPIQEVNSRRTREQHSEDSRKAGIASGKARREKATMRETLRMMLEDIPKDEENKLGLTNKQLATLGLIVGARNGNATNYRTILETIGELTTDGSITTPTLKIEVIDNSNLESKMYEENKHNENDNG